MQKEDLAVSTGGRGAVCLEARRGGGTIRIVHQADSLQYCIVAPTISLSISSTGKQIAWEVLRDATRRNTHRGSSIKPVQWGFHRSSLFIHELLSLS